MDVRITTKQRIASGVVLWILTLERLAYYALVSTFYLFLNKGPWGMQEGWDSLEALNAVFVLLGVSYISALIGGYISDAKLGRFFTIVLGMILYILGYILLILITVDKLPRLICSDSNTHNSTVSAFSDAEPQAPCKAVVYTSVLILGLGVGFVKANIGPFGAEQLGPSNPRLTRSFFNWYYWCSNVGSLIGIGALAFIEQDSPGICTNGFFCGYLIATVCLGIALSILVFLYFIFERHPSSANSPLFNIFRITWEATTRRVREFFSPPESNPPLIRPRFLDLAKVRNGGRFHEAAVDDVRSLGSMLVLFASLLPYWLVYFQIQTTFQAQGLHMRFMVNINHNSSVTVLDDESSDLETEWQFSVPAAWLTLFNQAFLIVALPLLTKFVYPYLDKSGVRMSMLARIGFGMFVSSIAVLVAGGLETFRVTLWKTDNSSHIIQTVGNVTYNAVDISIFWQIPQYMLVAAAESLASIAGLEYAYSEAPRSFQSLIMGLFYAMEGLGSFLGIALLQLLAPFWLNNMTDYANINVNHLDFYLYFLGVIQMMTLVIYTVTIYVSRFNLELVPLSCDEGIGGPVESRTIRVRPSGNRHRRRPLNQYTNYIIDNTNPRRRRSRDAHPLIANDEHQSDQEMIDPTNNPNALPIDDSDDSLSVKRGAENRATVDSPSKELVDSTCDAEEEIPGTPDLSTK